MEMSITTHYLIPKDKLMESVIKFWIQCYYKYLASGEYSELFSLFSRRYYLKELLHFFKVSSNKMLTRF